MGKNSGFLAWLRGEKRLFLLVGVAVVGLLLILLPSADFSPQKSGEVTDIETLCGAIDGVGECRVLLSFGEDGETVTAVAVICEGGDRLDVRHRLTELLSSFYGIGYNRISVERMA